MLLLSKTRGNGERMRRKGPARTVEKNSGGLTVRFTAAEDAVGFEVFKQSEHAESTQVAYDGVRRLWCEYLTTLEVQGGRREIEHYLTNVEGTTDKCYIWVGLCITSGGRRAYPHSECKLPCCR